MNKKSIALYGVGGCGLNLVAKVEATDPNRLIADYAAYYIDTSQSNLKNRTVDAGQVHIFDGKDGGGKIRANTHGTVSTHIDAVLSKMPPGTFNIVVCSASGGTGAVIAQSIAHQLLKDNIPVVMVVIGSYASQIEIENTYKTFRSLEQLASKKVHKPIVIHYLSNSLEVPREIVDEHAVGAISLLLGLFSGKHDELDSQDLVTWLQHDSLGERLVSLQFVKGEEQYAELKDVLSVATLAVPGANTIVNPGPAYQAVGYVPKEWTNCEPKLMGDATLHHVISDEVIVSATAEMRELEKAASAAIRSRGRRDTILNSTDSSDSEDGMIL